MIKRLNDNSNIIVAAFKIMYFVMTFAVFNIYFAYTSVLSYFSYVIAALGALILINRVVMFKDYYKSKYFIVSVLFLISGVVTIFVNIEYGLFENIQGLVWSTLEFLILLLLSPKVNAENIKNEIRVLFTVFILLTFASAVDSIAMVFQQYGGFKYVNSNLVVFGFVWNRLWGSYTDPNHGSVLAVVSVLISFYTIKLSKSKLINVFLVLNIIAEIIYIAFSDSRTGILCLIFAMLLFSFFMISNKKKVWIAFILAAIISFGSFGADKLVMYAYNNVYLEYFVDEEVTKKASHKMKFETDEDGNVNATVKKTKRSTAGRTDENSEDVSNNRFAIWKSGIEIYKTTPIVGTSYRNIFAYAKENLPNTFIVRQKFTCMHNLVFDVLVSQGAIGLILLVGYAFLILKNFIDAFKIWKKSKNREDTNLLMLMATIVLTLGISGMLVSAIMYVNCAIGVLFWMSLGYMNRLIAIEESNDKV